MSNRLAQNQSKLALYEDTIQSLAELLELDERLQQEIFEYVTEYGVVDFINNAELFALDEDVGGKLAAVKDVVNAYNEEYGDLIFSPDGGEK